MFFEQRYGVVSQFSRSVASNWSGVSFVQDMAVRMMLGAKKEKAYMESRYDYYSSHLEFTDSHCSSAAWNPPDSSLFEGNSVARARF